MRDILAEYEKAKYEKIWNISLYRKVCISERFIKIIPSLLNMKQGGKLIDFGCGTGRTSQIMKGLGYSVVGVDHAKNCLDRNVDIDFVEACLWDLPESLSGDYGLCTDVMEHIPEEKVSDVLESIKRSVPICFFCIDDEVDLMGDAIGERLHLTIKPMSWWYKKLRSHFGYVQGYKNDVFIVKR